MAKTRMKVQRKRRTKRITKAGPLDRFAVKYAAAHKASGLKAGATNDSMAAISHKMKKVAKLHGLSTDHIKAALARAMKEGDHKGVIATGGKKRKPVKVKKAKSHVRGRKIVKGAKAHKRAKPLKRAGRKSARRAAKRKVKR